MADWQTDIDARIAELDAALAYDGNKAAVGPGEMISALQEIKRLRADQRKHFQVGDYLGQVERDDGDKEFIHPFCGGHFGRDDYDLKRVVGVEPHQLTVQNESHKRTVVTFGETWAHPMFDTEEQMLEYRVPAAKARELGLP